MTDNEYIVALRNKDEAAIARLYQEYYVPFCRIFRAQFRGDVNDLYQESIVTLWQSVLSGKLKETDLGQSLDAPHKKRNILSYLILTGRYKMLNHSRKYKEIVGDEQIISYLFGDEAIDEESLRNKIERDKIIYSTVNMMKEPCAPLLNKFYWEKKTFEIIAKELNYANADSAKNQKARCYKKLKDIIKDKLIKAGLAFTE